MRKLGTLNVVGTITSVVHATKEEAGPTNIEDGGFAAYEQETATVFLRRWEGKTRPATAMFADLVHELVHVILWENGGTKLLESSLPHLSTEAREDIEERLVRALAPGLVTCFDDLIDLRDTIRKVSK